VNVFGRTKENRFPHAVHTRYFYSHPPLLLFINLANDFLGLIL